MRLSDIRISQKIGLAFAGMILGAAAMGLIVRGNLETIEAARLDKEIHQAIVTATIEARGALTREENSLRGFLLTRDDYYVERVSRHSKSFLKQIDAMRAALGNDPKRAEQLATIETNRAAWQSQIADRALELGRDPDMLPTAVALITSDEASKLIDPIEDTLDGLRDEKNAEIAFDSAVQITAFSHAQWTFLGCMGGLIVAAIAFAVLLNRGIARPIAAVCAGMERLAKGDTTIEIAGLGRRDEVGQMASALDRLKSVSAQNQVLEAGAQAARRTEIERQAADAASGETYASAHAFFMGEVEAGFARLSDGDLATRLSKPFSADYEAMRGLFNDSVSKLEEAFGAVILSVGTIRTGLSEISVASNDLSQRTEQQAASLEQTVAALSDVTRGIGETADGAHRAQAAASQAQKNAEKGNEIVGRAVKAMSQIEQSSDKIGKIIGVIDEIAFQTNLLALNAGVEAARAGEAGRGFAVVAQEVRGLAQRSAEAAKEIKSLISASSVQVSAGVELVTASGHSLDEIVTQVGEMSQVVAEIARSAREQAVSLKEVSAAADQMDKVTQQNAAMVEETTAAAQHLSTETDALATLTARFRVAATTPTAPVRRPTSAPARPVAQMRTTGRGGAAPAANHQADNWEEF